jgi:hypothetical protein
LTWPHLRTSHLAPRILHCTNTHTSHSGMLISLAHVHRLASRPFVLDFEQQNVCRRSQLGHHRR